MESGWFDGKELNLTLSPCASSPRSQCQVLPPKTCQECSTLICMSSMETGMGHCQGITCYGRWGEREREREGGREKEWHFTVSMGRCQVLPCYGRGGEMNEKRNKKRERERETERTQM